MDNYYLISQLPTLSFKSKLPISSEQFINEAAKWLSVNKVKYLASLQVFNFISKKEDIPEVKDYKRFIYQIISSLAQWRQAKRKNTAYALPEYLKEIERKNPLEQEKELLYICWKYLYEVQNKYNFEFAWLAIYILQIRILERLEVFDFKKGKEEYEKITDNLTEKAKKAMVNQGIDSCEYLDSENKN